MNSIPTSVPQAKIEDQGWQVTIRLQRRRGCATAAPACFLTFWLCGWAFGEIMALAALLGPHLGLKLGDLMEGSEGVFAKGFLVFWLTFWTFGGLMALRQWLLLVFGNEDIIVQPEGISHRIRPFPARLYQGFLLSNFRLSDTPAGRTSMGMQGSPAFQFEYQGKTVRLGWGLDRQEAEEILKLLQGRFPSLFPRPKQDL